MSRVAVRVKNVPGALGAVMTVVGNNGGNIFNMKVTNRNPLYFEFMVDIEVRDVAHLQNILGALRVNAVVESVDRAARVRRGACCGGMSVSPNHDISPLPFGGERAG